MLEHAPTANKARPALERGAPGAPAVPDATRAPAGLTARLAAIAVWLLAGFSVGAAAATLQVGPDRAIRTLAEAARRAQDGDTVEVDAGVYRRDVAVWQQDSLTLRAVGGRVRLLADGAAAEGKAIWVVRARGANGQPGHGVSVRGFDFEGTRVESRNGAGIRFEAGRLTVSDCGFFDNEMGLLTSNDARAELSIENSEFARNKRPDGHNHQLYAGSIGKLSVRGSHFHHATIGHLLKSRAAVNQITYNRLTDEVGGTGSYELEFPNGGVAMVVGNLIEQSAGTDNPIMISYGAEGYTHATNTLVLVHNTLVDKLPVGGVFLRVMPADAASRVDVWSADNLLVGNPGALDAAAPGSHQRNVHVGLDALADPANGDYRLRTGAAAIAGAASGAGQPSLQPTRSYVHPRATVALPGPPRYPGALQDLAAARAGGKLP